MTLYALFGDDVRVAAFRLSADIVFDALNITCLVRTVLLMGLDHVFKWNHTISNS